MKTYLQILKRRAGWPFTFALVLATSPLGVPGAETRTIQSGTGTVTITAEDNEEPGTTGTGGAKEKRIVIKAIEPGGAAERARRKELPWLGVATEEVSEALTSQLGLDPGVGLVATYIAADSPAMKAGLQKNDVLIEFEGQSLVLPAQLRKLVQARKEGDAVKLVFYRGGKKQTVSVTLAKTKATFGLLDGEAPGSGEWRELQLQLHDLPIRDAIREKMETVRESLSHVQIDQKKVQEEVRRAMDSARKAYREALQHATNAGAALGPARKSLEDFFKSEASLDNDATVTVRSTGQSVKSLVKADDSGTLVLVCNPKPHLTAHDKDGKLLFDGEIDTVEQRAKVPPEVLKRAEPLLEQVGAKAAEEPEAKPAPAKDSTSHSGSHPLLLTGMRGNIMVL